MLTIELSFSVWDHHGHSGLKSKKKVYCFVLISEGTYRIAVLLYFDKKIQTPLILPFDLRYSPLAKMRST